MRNAEWKMIALIDYNAGNLTSVRKALAAIESKANSFAPPSSLEPEPVPVGKDTGLGKKKTSEGKKSAALAAPQGDGAAADDGRAQMQKLFLDAKLISIADFDLAVAG